MAKVLLEDTLGEFCVDRTKGHQGIISENVGTGVTPLYRCPGRLSVCNIRNGNNRRYPTKVWERNIKDSDSKLRKLIEKNAAFGLLEHPDDGRVTLLSPIAVITTKADLKMEGTNLVVDGEITIVDTAEGRKLKALIEAGYNPYVSSRGYGTLTTGPDGIDEVQEDYVCEGWDVVFQPSFEQAELRPPRAESKVAESTSSAPPSSPPSVIVPATATAGGPVISPTVILSEGGAPKIESSAQSTKPKRTIMDNKTIRAQLDSIRGSVAGKPNSRQITEALGRCEELHREAARIPLNEDHTSWDTSKIHKDIDAIESNLTAMQNAPSEELTKLRESHSKLLQVAKTLANTAVMYRTKLVEAVQRNNKIRELSTKLLERGRAWKGKAETLQESNGNVDFEADVLSEALDQVVDLYNADIVKLSRKLMANKFGEAITPEIQARINEAKHPADLFAINEELEAVVKPKTATTEGKKPEAGKQAVTEGKKQSPAPVAEGVKVTTDVVRDPKSFTESLAITRRLSASLVTA